MGGMTGGAIDASVAAAWVVFAVVATALAQVAFKQYFHLREKRWLVAAIALFACVPWANYNALRGLPLATVYVASAVSQLIVVAISLQWLGERYTRRQQLGFALMLAGVVLFNL